MNLDLSQILEPLEDPSPRRRTDPTPKQKVVRAKKRHTSMLIMKTTNMPNVPSLPQIP